MSSHFARQIFNVIIMEYKMFKIFIAQQVSKNVF